MLTATTLALPPRTNIPRPTKKNPKDTPNRVFNKLAWHQNYGTEGVCHTEYVANTMYCTPVSSAYAYTVACSTCTPYCISGFPSHLYNSYCTATCMIICTVYKYKYRYLVWSVECGVTMAYCYKYTPYAHTCMKYCVPFLFTRG